MDKYIRAEDLIKSALVVGLWDGLNNQCIMLKLIKDAPAADVAPVVHGEWIFQSVSGEDPYTCSVCGNTVKIYGYTFCPYCGARMDGGE
jgi:hypothetical protein